MEAGRVQQANVTILVKALPQPSKTHGETVCCAGVTVEKQWKRLFPVRFRHLAGDSSFGRWDQVAFEYGLPRSDTRSESCHVHEETIKRLGKLSDKKRRTQLLAPMIVGSAKAAAASGHSLALIRPRNPRFIWKRRSADDVAAQKAAFEAAARQMSMFDRKLAELEPSPFEFRFRFEDEDGRHDYANADWESHTMFWAESHRSSEENALKWMDATFNDVYPRAGMVFALGNMARRPQTWQLLGVIRLNLPEDRGQGDLFAARSSTTC